MERSVLDFDVALDDDGGLTVAYRAEDPQFGVAAVFTRRRPGPGEAWGDEHLHMVNGSLVRMGVDAAGDVYLLWSVSGAGYYADRYSRAADQWDGPVLLGADGYQAARLDTQRAREGAVIVVSDRSMSKQLRAHTFVAGSGWTEASVLGAGEQATLDIALAIDGSATVVWALGPDYELKVATSDPNTGRWTGVATTLSGSIGPSRAEVDIDPAGNRSVLLGSTFTDSPILSWGSEGAQASWSAPVTVTASGRHPRFGLDAVGNGLALWTQDATYVARFDKSSGTWQQPTRLAASAAGSSLHVAPDGKALALVETGNAVEAFRFE
ncbi:MAG: hypothetical protein RBU37_24020 [Myxococcota bacterium]|nr:hypothetical protein [Myxococcota bacterium]